MPAHPADVLAETLLPSPCCCWVVGWYSLAPETAGIHDMDGLQAMMASPSPEDMAAQERHGVIQPIFAYSER